MIVPNYLKLLICFTGFFNKEINFWKISVPIIFLKNKLIQFIGHIESHEFSNEQMLIINDSENINSNAILSYDLTGSSYLLKYYLTTIERLEDYKV